MTFVPAARGLGRFADDMTDFVDSGGFTNPDGTPTYNGAPYDQFDPFNPYNVALSNSPSSIPLATTSIGPSPLATSAPAPLVNYTPGGNAGTVVASGLPAVATPTTATATATATTSNPLSSLTSALSSLSSLFSPKATGVALSPSGSVSTVKPATTSSIGGLSTSTLLLLGLVGIGAVVLLGKKRAS